MFGFNRPRAGTSDLLPPRALGSPGPVRPGRFPILEHYSNRLEELEDEVLSQPRHETVRQIHAIKRELLIVRRAVWPVREVIASLVRERHENLSETTRAWRNGRSRAFCSSTWWIPPA